MKIRKAFWTKSKQFKEWCNDEELWSMKGQIERELGKRMASHEKKYLTDKPKRK